MDSLLLQCPGMNIFGTVLDYIDLCMLQRSAHINVWVSQIQAGTVAK